jgi:hypothetical protein
MSASNLENSRWVCVEPQQLQLNYLALNLLSREEKSLILQPNLFLARKTPVQPSLREKGKPGKNNNSEVIQSE